MDLAEVDVQPGVAQAPPTLVNDVHPQPGVGNPDQEIDALAACRCPDRLLEDHPLRGSLQPRQADVPDTHVREIPGEPPLLIDPEGYGGSPAAELEPGRKGLWPSDDAALDGD